MKKLLLLIILTLSAFTSYSQVFKFKTTLSDIEVSGEIIRSVREVCYHTFDFDNLKVIYEGVNSEGDHIKVSYPIKRTYQKGVYTACVVNDKGMKEIWFSKPDYNIIYDLDDGKTSLVLYGMARVK
jgi:hypothetical protein